MALPSPHHETTLLLLVDDDPDFLQFMKDMLLFHLPNTEVDTAVSAEAALELIPRRDYDALVSDILLPQMDGLTFMSTVFKRWPEIPTLLITAHGDRELGVKALRSGAYAYMQKPFDREYFLAWLRRAIERRRLGRRVAAHDQAMQARAEELERAVQALQSEIEGHHRAEALLRESEERFRRLAEATFEAIAVTEQGRLVEVNENFVRMFGYDREQLTSMHAPDFHPPDQRDLVRRMNLSGQEAPYETIYVTKDGRQFPAEIRGKAMPYQGRTVRVTAIRDISGQKQTEEALRQSEERFRLLVERVKDYAIFLVDTDGRVVSWNEGAALLKGYRSDEIIGRPIHTFYIQEDVRAHKARHLLKQAAEQGRVEDEGWRVRKDGSRFWAHVVITALRDGNGQLQAFAKVTRDLTERRRTEERLREAHQQLEQRVIERTHELEEANRALQEKNRELEEFADVVVGRELKMIDLEKEVKRLREELERLNCDAAEQP